MSGYAELVGWTVTVLAVAGAVLNCKLRISGFYLWCVANGLSAGLHLRAGMYALAGRDVVFFALAVWGIHCWRKRDA